MHNHLLLTTRYHNNSFTCTGTVVDYAFMPHLPLRHKIIVSLDTLCLDITLKHQKARGYTIALHTKQSYQHLVGSHVKIHNIVLKPSSVSFSLFCIRNKLLGSAHKPLLHYEILNIPTYSFTRFICSYKQRMLHFFKEHIHHKTFALFSTLFLGNNDLIKKNVQSYQNTFQNWGIVHYLARSGLHLVIVTMLFEYMLYCIPWSFTVGRIVILLCGLLYWILTWTSLSFSRAFILFILSHTARVFRRPHHFLHMLLLTGFIFLIFNPVTLFFIDFQLTFGITLALGLFNYTPFKPLA